MTQGVGRFQTLPPQRNVHPPAVGVRRVTLLRIMFGTLALLTAHVYRRAICENWQQEVNLAEERSYMSTINCFEKIEAYETVHDLRCRYIAADPVLSKRISRKKCLETTFDEVIEKIPDKFLQQAVNDSAKNAQVACDYSAYLTAMRVAKEAEHSWLCS